MVTLTLKLTFGPGQEEIIGSVTLPETELGRRRQAEERNPLEAPYQFPDHTGPSEPVLVQSEDFVSFR